MEANLSELLTQPLYPRIPTHPLYAACGAKVVVVVVVVVLVVVVLVVVVVLILVVVEEVVEVTVEK